MIKERMSKQDLMDLYGVDRVTIEDWRRNKGLKMIEVSSHSKYITKEELLQWEDSLKGNSSVKRLINQSVSE
jgi:hypothetical protein